MKTRNGFVSNSSSSSFVVVGTYMNGSDLKDLGWIYDEEEGIYDYDKMPNGIEVYYTESGGYIVGIPIVKSEEWGLDSKDMTQTEIDDVFLQVSKKLPNREIKLLMGNRPT